MKWKQPEHKATDAVSSVHNQSVVRKKILAAVAAVILLAGLALLGLASFRSTQTPDQQAAATGCQDTSENGVLAEASKLLDARKSGELKPVVAKIQAIKDYDKDPNCMNVVVTYYINISDLNNARTNLEKLEKVYDMSQGFSTVLGPNVKKIEVLREDVAFLARQEELFRKNIKHSPGIGQ